MKRYFNIEGGCRPDEHYMVRLDERLKLMKEQYVDRGKYFVINRGRQYGKTTTLRALAEYLKPEYLVLSMDFQKISNENFENEQVFVRAFIRQMSKLLKNWANLLQILGAAGKADTVDMLFDVLSSLCEASEKPIVLLIDEVDSASNNQVFIDFLAQLRGYYLDREDTPTFHSVILAGVYDIKNLKLKIRPDAEHQYNSPWNIAAEFDISMSLSAEQIAEMLSEYEADNHTNMDIEETAKYIYSYTSGYPYLVSAICKMLDEKIPAVEGFGSLGSAWTRAGIDAAVKMLLNKRTTLFDSMIRQMSEYPEIKKMLKAILFQGKRISYNADTYEINLASMFGYIKESSGSVQVANRIFEMRLCNLFLSEEELTEAIYDRAQGNIPQFIKGGRLNMDLALAKFVEYFSDIYGDNTEKFLEENGRKFFLLFLKPIINGTGNYYLEAQTRNARRTDVIVDYLGEQFIIEMKIWHGNEYNKRGEEQLTEYLDYYHLEKGYMLSFNFNKEKETGVKEIKIGNKTIVEAVV